MTLSRNLVIKLNNILDDWIPPKIRDVRLLSYLPAKILFGKHATTFLEFRNKGFFLKKEEMNKIYSVTSEVAGYQGETDLNEKCLKKIYDSIVGKTVLDVGCGRGYLAGKLSHNYAVSASDIFIETNLKQKYSRVKFREADVQSLPYRKDHFDTVICCHTLEHVQNLSVALAELRRIVKKRLIIVVPKQRPYRYIFSMHLHFFPYDWSVWSCFGFSNKKQLFDLGDWLYIEDF